MNVSEVLARMTEQANLSLVIFTMGLLLCRVMPVLVLSPFLGGEVVPPEVKMGVGVMIAAVLFPAVSPRMGAIPTSALPYIGLMLKEIFIGVALSSIVNVVFEAARVAGNIVDTMSGSNNAQLYVPQLGQQVSIFASLKVQLAVVLFLTLNGHHLVIEALADSLVVVPLDRFPRFSSGEWAFFELFIRSFADLLKISLALAAPPTLAAFLTDMALGAVNRVAPQVQVFFISMAIKPLVGVVIVFMSLGLIMGRMQTEFAAMLAMLRDAVRLLG
ncbi:flagellar biosynthetic protein FliR [Vitiosangium sp. GDMCC 1.1324]|uniref:flagellar biosynthetic protein FliR n=1 Tax=Vitiosangium sp. (strain GDMCC 1.1324) TaxID=2138576 RepID=UPI000D3A62B0|nr:flagellar biosynthetic protein FliR [Vitiosangium sp. GDMCC 1.1324]PTL80504.1 type III secretion protein [Vitiosangium sp. GDMCC 1.1324]